jgi:hypothetical protein
MSQLQVTGEAKIRDIQGPVVANSGVVTALDGDASQYVRGDGTLADFPTSTGGGSSVSYYLNSSVSQGTIGGVAYRQLGKTPIAGAGTDITTSTNGYVASYITDSNDPALLEVPAGNFNCEFYFSVNSDAHNPFVYAEVYKYDGTTFTLIGSSQSVPEYLTNGTTLSPYYFAIPVAQTVLAITDRIAIRIYVNVDGRTVTLHTENNHLCQVVTTFSKGLTSLNNLTRQVQFLATGTSGTDFNISSVTATHTFNLPVASASNTGKLSSSDWSTFNGKQAALSFTAPLVNTTNTISIPVATSTVDGYLDNADWVTFNSKQNAITLTTTGTSGVATLVGATLNIPNYTTDLSDYVTLSTTQTISGTKTFSAVLTATNSVNIGGSTGFISDATLVAQINTPPSSDRYFAVNNNGAYGLVMGYTTTSGRARIANISNSPMTLETNNTVALTLAANQAATFASSVTATSIIKTGGTSSQFLMADGSVNTSVLPSGAYLPLSGGTLTGSLSGTSGTFSSTVTANSLIKTGGTSAQILAADGSVITAGTNITISGGTISTSGSGITGSGTTNYIPKFTGASSIGNSLIFDNGTNIGIGLTSPSYKLDVQDNGVSGIVDVASFSVTGNGGSGRGVGILLGAAGSSNSVQVARLVGYHELAISSAVAASFAIQVANSSGTLTERLRVTQAGNLIIGTTTDAGARLLISGGYTGFQYNSAGAYPAYNTYFGAIGTNFSNSNSELDIWNTVGGGFVFRKQTGASAQTALLTIASSGAATFSSSVSGTSIRSSAVGSFGFNTANNGEFQIYGTATDGMLIAGRGSTNDLVLLNKNGSDVLRVPTGTTTVSLQSLTGSGSRAVLADASGNLSAPVSDISVKENIKPIGYGLNEVLKMNPVWFDFIDEYKNYGQGRQNGNIAQEMEAIIPEAVFITPSTGKMGINYDQLHAVYIKAIQELEARIKQLENK